MTNLELVEHDLTPCGNGLPIIRTVVAVSTSATALSKYCKDEYGTEVGHNNVNEHEKYYTIQEGSIKIVPFNYELQKKFDGDNS